MRKQTHLHHLTYELRELTESETYAVSGGNFGTGAGGIFGPRSFGAATRFSGGLGLLYGSFQVGWAIGTAVYNFGSRRYYNRHHR